MKKLYFLFPIFLLFNFSVKADVFTITMSTINVGLAGSNWIITDTFGNILATDSNINSSGLTSSTTTVNVSGAPYLFQMYSCTTESVYFELMGSSLSAYFYIPDLDCTWRVSNSFWSNFFTPVNFGNIEVSQNTNYDYVHFNTYSESNCKKFVLQKSSMQNDFIDIDETDSKSIQGNSSVELNYVFRNYNIEAGEILYRVKQLDYDEKVSYSKIVSLRRKEIEKCFNVYPNPIKDVVKLEFEKSNASLLQVSIFSYTGNLLKRLYSGKPIIQLATNLKELERGYYFIQVVMDNEIVYSKSVIKE